MKRKDNVFTDTALSRVDSSRFDLGHEKKLTFNMGQLVPVCLMEAVPGDRFSLSYANLLRFAPLVSPVMHRVRVKTEYFFVPNRILFPEWEEFITGVSGTPVAAPTVTIDGNVPVGSLADYLGIPPGDYSLNPLDVSAIPMAAYYKIYDEWYRDQNLISEKFAELIPGNNPLYDIKTLAKPLNRAWEHDYFTSALPTAQQGQDVDLPLVNQQEVEVTARDNGSIAGNTGFFRTSSDFAPLSGDSTYISSAAGPSPLTSGMRSVESGAPLMYDPHGTLVVDIQAEAATINDLREAFSLQAFLERTIRGGARYIEQIFSHFGVKSSDARLQRPELIGRSVQNMVISEVLSTAQSSNDGSTAEIAVGSMAGHAISVGGNDTFTYNCEEHGFIIGLVSVIPDTAYQDGLHRLFSRKDRLDYIWPSFAHLGEQEIYNKEIMCHDVDGSIYSPDNVFGYVPRYSEYRYHPSGVAGQFRDTLSFWTLGRQFSPDAPPNLNDEFVTCEPSRDIFAVVDPEVDTIFAQVINNHTVVRKLPRYGVPSTL